MDNFQARVIESLNTQDERNKGLLAQVITAAAAASDPKKGDVVIDPKETNVDNVNAEGGIRWGGKNASLQGTGGVALLEYAKDAIQTAVSNISGVGTAQIANKKVVERKVGQIG